METVRLGRTEIITNKNGFGVLPLQRAGRAEAIRILRKALDNDITFYNTARIYTDSEEKLGIAFEGRRHQVFLASKVMARTVEGFWQELETSLKMLKTDYLDLYQFHNPPFCPSPGSGDGLYEQMLKAKRQGKIRHIGITNHRMFIALEAVRGGWYDTMQFPFSYLASQADIDLVRACERLDMGFLAMKGLSGGLITNAKAAYAFMSQYHNVLPIWGIQRESELDEFIQLQADPPRMDAETVRQIEADRIQLAGDFCRGCGYCMPCPAEIDIKNCARVSLLLRRAVTSLWINEEAQAKMRKVEDCLHCGQCEERCPYGLKVQLLLQKNLQDYREVLAGKAL